jgi:hypothetical protein
MDDIFLITIPLDFKVKFVKQENNGAFFYGVDELFHKFIFLTKTERGSALSQYLIHRYDLATTFREQIPIEYNSKHVRAINNVRYKFKKRNDGFEFWIQNPYNKQYFLCNLTPNIFPAFLDDLELLGQIKDQLKTIKSINKAKQLLKVKEIDDVNFTSIIDTDAVELILFEKHILKRKLTNKSINSFFYFYFFALNENLGDISFFEDELNENIEHFFNKHTCDCGDNNCLFSLLKSTQVEYFSGDYLINNELSTDRIRNDINLFWNSLSKQQKAAILVLQKEIIGIPLLNFSILLEPVEKFIEYQTALIYPYQPDSIETKSLHKLCYLARSFSQRRQ